MHRAIWMVFACFCSLTLASAQTDVIQQTPPATNPQKTADTLRLVDQLVEQNGKLEKQNRELIEQIRQLREILAQQSGQVANEQGQAAPATPTPTAENVSGDVQEGTVSAKASPTEERDKWGRYTPNLGFKVANTDHGDLSISIYTYARYLNQLGLDATYTDAFGNTKNVQQRQDFQLQKVQIKFLGWMFDPKFRYFLYAWTSNPSQGLPAQVVLAGNLNYTFKDWFSVGAGIRSLPGTRSVEGNFPFWLGVDSRLMADEFFRPSYTSGVWASGKVAKNLEYIGMVGNNLSTLGVSAAQLDNGFNTISTSLVWKPTTGEFGPGFGDFENHEKFATRLGAHFTYSQENKQSQPNSEGFENTQIRLSDGSVIFTPNLFGPGITVTDVTYKMTSFDGGIKYRGLSLESEYYLRWLNHFHGPGTQVIPERFDQGVQAQISAMVVPKLLQIYAGGSTILGQYGQPWDFRLGTNLHPFKNRVVRWNSEFLYLRKSAVGYTALPYPVGGNGPVFHTSWELAF
ncbi:MAG TPA: cell division protein ZapB [Candidatus Binatia bacterium]|nr:cell division protein ZapB [Candidatus Binatia bacterium]